MPAESRITNLAGSVTDQPPRAPKKRRIGWWILLGGLGGVVLTVGVLMLPPVQAWLLRKMVTGDPDATVEFSRVAVGPGGGEATDVRVRLPNLTIEARALRLAISPWQLLSRRRLAIADLQARQIAIRAASTPTTSAPAVPFMGLLDGLQAPLAWACSKAEADGTLTLDQPGAAPIVAGFSIKGADLDIAKPGRIEFEFTTPGSLVAGFNGTWKFAGTLDFTATADEHIDRVVIEGQLHPAASADYRLPPVRVRLVAARTPQGETYEVTVAPELRDAEVEFSGQAAFTRSDGRITGTWQARGGSAMAAHVLQRSDLPRLRSDTKGTFALDAKSGAAEATAVGGFSGDEWQRFLPELAAIGRVQGRHSLRLERRNGQWRLENLETDATSDGSKATMQLRLERPVVLPPGGDGDTTPWGRLSLRDVPMGWLTPVMEIGTITGGDMNGEWSLSSPDAGRLRFTPLGPLRSATFTVTDPSLPAIPPLTLEAEARMDLTPEHAFVDVDRAVFASEKGDRIEARIGSKADLDKLIADTKVDWSARLPTWLGAQGPLLRGALTADVTENFATVRTFEVTAAHDASADAAAFRLEALKPFKVDYEGETTKVEPPEGDLARFTARNLRLDWASSLLEGLSLSGAVTDGDSILRREGRGFTIIPGQPWTLENLSVIQGGLPLLSAPRFTLAAEGRIELDDEWMPRDFAGTIKFGGGVAEVFRLRDPAGPLTASGAASLTRINGRLELRTFQFNATRVDGGPLLTLETLLPIVLGATAKNNEIDKAAEVVRLRTAAVPLAWFEPLLPAGMKLVGTLEPAEFSAKIDLPNAFLNPTKPVALTVQQLDNASGPVLRDVRVEFSPALILMGKLIAAAVEKGRVTVDGRDVGGLGLSALYFTHELQIPITANLDVNADVSLLRRQPFASTMSLPATGQARFIFQHDLMAGKESTATFLLQDVQSPDGSGPLSPLGIRITKLDTKDKSNRVRLEFQYQTKPTWSAFVTEFDFDMVDKRAKINAELKGEFFDVGRFMKLIDACAPATVPAPAPKGAAGPAPAKPVPAKRVAPKAPFWETLSSRIQLEFGAIEYGTYRVERLTGEFVIDEDAVDLRKLAGKMFDGDWSGRLRLGFDRTHADDPFELTGGFDIKDFSATRIVQAAYPNEIGSYDGRLNFSSTIHSRGAWFDTLLDDSTSEFTFHSDKGRLRLKVPHANLASAALLVGGAVTFSPELRAIGRLVKTFSDLPVDELSARGRRVPGGAIFLDDLRLQTPQLRLVARGEMPAQPQTELAARTFSLPVTLAVRDEMAVILRGMKLIERKADADGYFTMTRQPKLRGTFGAPDTTELYDTFAQAVAGSSGTFGFLMKKVQQEVEKSRAAGAAAKK